MKKKIMMMAYITAVAIHLIGASDALSLFHYDASKMNSGTLYSYEFKDGTGTKQGELYFYIKQDTAIEIFRKSETNLSLFTMNFDTHYFVFDAMKFENPFAYIRIPNSLVGGAERWNFNKKTSVLEMTTIDHRASERKEFYTTFANFLPCYNIGHFFLDFALAMRHYRGTKKDRFEIGYTQGGNFVISTVSFEKEEVVNGTPCEKWIIRGKGLLAWAFNVKVELWFAKNDPYYRLVQYKNNMKDFFIRFLVLTAIDTMSEAAWRTFLADNKEEMRKKLGYPPKQ